MRGRSRCLRKLPEHDFASTYPRRPFYPSGSAANHFVRSLLAARGPFSRLAHNKTDSISSLFRSGRLGSLRARGKLELDLSFGVQDEACAKMFAASASESGYYVICTSLCKYCLLYTSPSPRDRTRSRMP